MIGKLRLFSSLLIYAFVTCHLLTISFALLGLHQLDQAATWLTDPWLHSPLKYLLMPSMVVHVALGMYALYLRNTLRMSTIDTVQYLTGFLLPLVLLPHMIGVSIATEFKGGALNYSDVLASFWVYAPWSGLLQAIALLTAWMHGSIGLLTLLHTKRWWPTVVWWVNPSVVAVPILAMLGFVEGGRIVVVTTKHDPVTQADTAFIELIESTVSRAQLVFVLLLAAVLVARFVRLSRGGSQNLVLQYTDGPTIQSVAGKTVLEISHLYGVPHANLCRGRGRCGTCRCNISVSDGSLPSMATLEKETLKKVNAAQGQRLACQCIPTAGVYTVERLVAPDIGYGFVADARQPSEPATTKGSDA